MERHQKIIYTSGAALLLSVVLTLCITGCALNEKNNTVTTKAPGIEEQEKEQIAKERQVLYWGETRICACDLRCELEDLVNAFRIHHQKYEKFFDALHFRQELTKEKPLCQTEAVDELSKAAKKLYADVSAMEVDNEILAYGQEQDLKEAYNQFILWRLENLSGEHSEQKQGSIEHFKITSGYLVKNSEKLLSVKDLVELLKCANGLEIHNVTVEEYAEEHHIPEVEFVLTETQKETQEEELLFDTIYVEDPSLYEGQSIVMQEGKSGKAEVTYEVVYENGREISRKVVASKVLAAPEHEIVHRGVMLKGTATGSFIWTTEKGYISSPYGSRYIEEWNEWNFHSGVDIAVEVGTKLYAGDGGTVIHAGNRGNGYGIYVIIDHGNGFTSYYGHMSKVAVQAGDKVNKGDLIGFSGATGNVTGPHVHYEIRVNGKTKNPEDYLPDFYEKTKRS